MGRLQPNDKTKKESSLPNKRVHMNAVQMSEDVQHDQTTNASQLVREKSFKVNRRYLSQRHPLLKYRYYQTFRASTTTLLRYLYQKNTIRYLEEKKKTFIEIAKKKEKLNFESTPLLLTSWS